MRLNARRLFIAIALAAAVLSGFSASLAAHDPTQHEHDAGVQRHPPAATLKNPVPADAASIAAGEALYMKHCSACHGDKGKGDGEMGDDLDPKPSNLTDAQWKHGSTDGEIFTVIRDGITATGMKSFSRKLAAHQIWDVINYIRSIGPEPTKSH